MQKFSIEMALTYPPLTRSVTVSDTESSPAVEYYIQRKNNNPQGENMLKSKRIELIQYGIKGHVKASSVVQKR